MAETAEQMAKATQRQSTVAATTSENARQTGKGVRRVADATQRMAGLASHTAKLGLATPGWHFIDLAAGSAVEAAHGCGRVAASQPRRDKMGSQV